MKSEMIVKDSNGTGMEEPQFAQLLFILEGMVKRYERLLVALQKEKKLMIEWNLEDLVPCLLEKEGLLEELKQLEAQRIHGSDRLIRRLPIGLPEGSPRGLNSVTMKQLMKMAPLCYREQLSSCYDRLRALLASVAEINTINGLLMDRIARQVRALLALLTHFSTIPDTYEVTGMLNGEVEGSRLIRSTGLHVRG